MYASIDIGTNTVLLLVADIKDGRSTIHHEEQRMPRLGRSVDSSKNLHADSVERVLDVLKEYRELLEKRFAQVSDVVVTATSAVRDANNREQFIKQVKEETGFEIQLLSGLEEAEYTYSGALSVLPEIGEAIVIDIGGGSTEIAFGKNGKLIDSHSFDIGSVRFSERYLKDDPPSHEETIRCRKAIKAALQERIFDFNLDSEPPELVGVAGTVTSLAYMDGKLHNYNPKKLNGYQLSIEKIDNWVEHLSTMEVQEIEAKYPKVMKERADVIVGGLLILENFMKYYSIPKLTVSTGGIRHGSLLNRNK